MEICRNSAIDECKEPTFQSSDCSDTLEEVFSSDIFINNFNIEENDSIKNSSENLDENILPLNIEEETGMKKNKVERKSKHIKIKIKKKILDTNENTRTSNNTYKNPNKVMNSNVTDTSVNDFSPIKSELQEDADRQTSVSGTSKFVDSAKKQIAPMKTLRKIVEIKHEKDPPFKIEKTERCCGVCNEEFSTYYLLLSHMSVHFPNYACSQCGKKFVTIGQLKGHRKQHHNNPTVTCKVCEKEVKKCSMPRHVGTHTGVNNIYRCPSCPERFKNFAMRIDHMAKFHNGESHAYKCKLCPKTYRLASSLSLHLRKIHCSERKHICVLCDEVFFKSNELRDHTLRHTSNSFRCNVCGQSYVRKTKLNAHMKVHITGAQQMIIDN